MNVAPFHLHTSDERDIRRNVMVAKILLGLGTTGFKNDCIIRQHREQSGTVAGRFSGMVRMNCKSYRSRIRLTLCAAHGRLADQ